jgi:hypothetical protein
MTVITSFLESLWEHLDWDNGQLEHTYDWDCLTMHTFVPCPQFFCLLKPITHVCTPKMAEDELSDCSTSSHVCPELCNKPLFLPPPCLFGCSEWVAARPGVWISGVWALGPKLLFQQYRNEYWTLNFCKICEQTNLLLTNLLSNKFIFAFTKK